MRPSVGVIEFNGTKKVAPTVNSVPIAMPTTAVSSGNPAASRLAKVTQRMIMATASPAISLIGSTATGSAKPRPPASTVSPASREMFIASVTAARSSSVTSAGTGTSKLKLSTPVRPSSDTARRVCASSSAVSRGSPISISCWTSSFCSPSFIVTGLCSWRVSPRFWTSCLMASTVRSIAAMYSGSFSCLPSGAWKTTLTIDSSPGSPISGNFSRSSSVACVEGMSSISKTSLKPF